MDIQEYINKKKEFYASLFEFIEENEVGIQQNYLHLSNLIKTQNIINDKREFKDFLRLLSKIAKNHHNSLDFFPKIYKILLDNGSQIKQTFSNSEIHQIFKNNKLILLFLIKNEILTFDDYLFKKIYARNQIFFFYPEAKPFLSDKKRKQIESQLIKTDSNIFDKYEELRQNGENQSYLAQIIRNDSVEEFVSYVNKANIQLTSTIRPSFFEINKLLRNSHTTLIQYATFFGSIQIFQYLQMNDVKLDSSLWIYAIHSNNAELIHLLENYRVQCEKEICLKESIKCHHNKLANYILTNIIGEDIEKINIENKYDNLYSYCFRYLNFEFFPDNLNSKFIFYNACHFGFLPIVNYFIDTKKIDINKTIICILWIHKIFIFNIYLIQNSYLKQCFKSNLFVILEFRYL